MAGLFFTSNHTRAHGPVPHTPSPHTTTPTYMHQTTPKPQDYKVGNDLKFACEIDAVGVPGELKPPADADAAAAAAPAAAAPAT